MRRQRISDPHGAGKISGVILLSNPRVQAGLYTFASDSITKLRMRDRHLMMGFYWVPMQSRPVTGDSQSVAFRIAHVEMLVTSESEHLFTWDGAGIYNYLMFDILAPTE